MLKIAQISPRYSPSVGGVERVVKEISEELARRGHHVAVLTTKRTQKNQSKFDGPSYELINGVHVHRYSSLISFGHMSVFPGAIFKLLTGNYDIVHMHSIRQPHTIYIPILRMFKNFKVILQGHTHFSSGKFKTIFYSLFDKIAFRSIYKKIDLFFVLNKDEMKKFSQLGVNTTKIKLLYNPIKESLFENDTKNDFLEKHSIINKKILLFLGQAHNGKRIDLIIKALPQIKKKFNEIKLIIAGPDFGNYPKLKLLGQSYGIIDDVLFLGELSEEEKEKALKSCSILILPSDYEAFGMVLAEAMACGKPVIATRTPGPIEIITDGQNGILIKRDSVLELATNTIALLSDEELYKRIGNTAKEWAAKKFSIMGIADHLEKNYYDVLNANL